MAKFNFSTEDIVRMRYFLACQAVNFTRDQKWESYQSWSKGGNGWHALRSGGTNIVQALTWYQHKHKPGSKEWRPPIIIAAVFEASKQTAIPEGWRKQAGLS